MIGENAFVCTQLVSGHSVKARKRAEEMRGLLPFDSEIVAVLQLMSFGLAFTTDRNHSFTDQAITSYYPSYTSTFPLSIGLTLGYHFCNLVLMS